MDVDPATDWDYTIHLRLPSADRVGAEELRQEIRHIIQRWEEHGPIRIYGDSLQRAYDVET